MDRLHVSCVSLSKRLGATFPHHELHGTMGGEEKFSDEVFMKAL